MTRFKILGKIIIRNLVHEKFKSGKKKIWGMVAVIERKISFVSTSTVYITYSLSYRKLTKFALCFTRIYIPFRHIEGRTQVEALREWAAEGKYLDLRVIW